MFGPMGGAMGRYLDAQAKKDLPHRKVLRATFVKRMVKAGRDEASAERQATIAEALGAEVLVGDEWLSIKEK